MYIGSTVALTSQSLLRKKFFRYLFINWHPFTWSAPAIWCMKSSFAKMFYRQKYKLYLIWWINSNDAPSSVTITLRCLTSCFPSKKVDEMPWKFPWLDFQGYKGQRCCKDTRTQKYLVVIGSLAMLIATFQWSPLKYKVCRWSLFWQRLEFDAVWSLVWMSEERALVPGYHSGEEKKNEGIYANVHWTHCTY